MNKTQLKSLSHNENFMTDIAKFEMKIVNKYKIPWCIAQDVVMTAVEYSLPVLLDPSRSKSATDKDFDCLVKSNAKRRALDECNRIKRNPVKDSIDEMKDGDTDCDGLGRGEHPALTRVAMETWRAASVDAELREKAQLCWKLLPSICRVARVSVRDMNVYREFKLERVSADDVCQTYSINTNNLYKICHTVGKRLAEYGPEIVEAAFCA